ncbi:MAG TPA: ABC transporter permease [Microvirga sp.]
MLLRLAPVLTLALILAPVGAGLLGTLLPAFGILPALGRSEPSLDPWRALIATPGLSTSLWLTIGTGLGATAISFMLAVAFCASAADSRAMRRMERALPALLATPHVAVAIGLGFLIAPSGFVVRLLSPELTGWERPPDIATVKDPYGLSFMAGLVLKETPYLILMIASAGSQVPVRALLAASRAMGHAAPVAWLKVVLPQIYGQIRLPVYAVLAFSLSVVEVALILAPGTPPPLSVLAARWFAGYELDLYFPAAAAALLQVGVVLAGIGLWRGLEVGAAHLGSRIIERGGRGWRSAGIVQGAGLLAVLAGALAAAALLTLVLWAFTQEWRFPDAFPSAWSLAATGRLASAADTTGATVAIAALSALIAVALALGCLENEQRHGVRPGSRALWLLAVPLLLPQIAFVFGTQVVLVRIGLDGTLAAVVWAHLVFVLPYVFLSLADPYRALDPRFARIAAGLGAAPMRIFLAVKVPLLLKPILVAFAVGFAVSISLYLPTLFAGAGRISTLTTEAVTLASGADRRLVGATALAQTVLPLAVYALALLLPSWFRRMRGGMR